MKLREWLKEKNVTLEDFGARISRSAATVSRIADGQDVSAETAREIFRATGGEVTPNDLILRRTEPEAAA